MQYLKKLDVMETTAFSVNSSRGIIAAYKQDKYASFGPEAYADASRQAVVDMIEDINGALGR